MTSLTFKQLFSACLRNFMQCFISPLNALYLQYTLSTCATLACAHKCYELFFLAQNSFTSKYRYIFGLNFASMMFPALQALDAIAVPTTSYSHPGCAQTRPLHSVNSDCLVLYILCLCYFFHSCLCFIFVFICYNVHLRSTTSSAMHPYIIPHFFSSNVSTHPCSFSR